MPKFREKQPVFVVDADVWDPAKGKPHVGVAAHKAPDGTFVGTIHRVDGSIVTGILPGAVIITHPAVGGAAPTFEAMLPDAFHAFYEPVVEAHSPVVKPGKKTLAAENDKDKLPTE